MNDYLIDLARFFGLMPVRRPTPMDPHVADLVQAFNRHGLYTFASCQGHLFEGPGAYVSFTAPLDAAHLDLVAALDHHLEVAQSEGGIQLNWYWRIEPSFRSVLEDWVRSESDGYHYRPLPAGKQEKHTLAFCLRPRPCGRWTGGLLNTVFPRGRWDQDFKKLERLLDEVLPKLKQADETLLVQVGHEK